MVLHSCPFQGGPRRTTAEKLVYDSDRPVLMEVFTTMRDDSDAVKMLVAANASMSLKGKLVASLSPEAKRRIKKLLGR